MLGEYQEVSALEYSEVEDRWITIGVDSTGVLRVVVHTFEQIGESLCEIRIISARKATRREARQYRERSI
ncbi:MAG: BrnT family toxin [Anaerolineae bacterium]